MKLCVCIYIYTHTYLFKVSNDWTLGPPKDRNCSYKITVNQNNKIKIPDKIVT